MMSCRDNPSNNKPTIDGNQPSSGHLNSKTYIRELRLGESNYYLQLPNTFKLIESRGKEGQLGYNIIPNDTSSRMFGQIEIKRGNGIDEPFDKTVKVFRKSRLVDREVEWRMYVTETGYFDAYTTEVGDLNATASSKNLNEVDSLISIISTLKENEISSNKILLSHT